MKRKRVSYAKYGYLFSLPFVIGFLLCMLFPIAYTLVIGFTDLKGLGNTTIHFLDNPFQNFQNVLKNQSFQTALGNTFKIWIWNFIPQIVLALVLAAWFTDDRMKIRGKGFFKMIFYMPNIITAATVAMLFSSLFGYPMGPVNDLLESLKLIDSPIQFPQNKLVSQLVVAFIQFWMWYGQTMIVLIAGILGISPDIFEAADIDGANSVQKFFYVTLPNLKTILLFTLVTSLIGGLQMYDIPRMYLNGGPDDGTLTTSVFIHNQAFGQSYLYNRAAAASLIMFAIIAVLSIIIFYLLRDKDEIAARKIEKQKTKEYQQRMKEAQKAEEVK